MHTYGAIYSTSTGFNLVYGVLINSLFNTAVSIFVLISGYFGINGTVKKYIKFEIQVLFYSIVSEVVISLVNSNWSIKDFIEVCLPVSSGKYWYITSYMLLLLFSKYLNRVPEKLKTKDFEKLLLLMFFIFSAVPTVVQFHVMDDGGKGFANMLLMYFIVPYIRLYQNEELRNPKKVFTIGLIVILLGFVLNLILTMLRGGKGVYAPFARDCSCIIIIASIAIFILFKGVRIQSKIINQIAKYVIAVYLFEGAIRTFLGQFFDITIYADRWYLFGVLLVYVLVVMAVCMMVDAIRSKIAKPIEALICDIGEKSFNLILERCEKLRM